MGYAMCVCASLWHAVLWLAPQHVEARAAMRAVWPAAHTPQLPQAGSSVAIDPVAPRDMVVGFNDYASSQGLTVCWSDSSGQDWHAGTLPAFGGAQLGDPQVAVGPAHRFYLAGTMYRHDAQHRPTEVTPALFVSTDGGRHWQRRMLPAGAAVPRSVGADDQPYVAVDPSGTVAVAWTRQRAGQAAMVITTSHDEGRSFDAPQVVPFTYMHTGTLLAAGAGQFVIAYEALSDWQHMWIGLAVVHGGSVSLHRVAALQALPSPLPGFAFRVNSLPQVAFDRAHGRLYVVWNAWVHDRATVLIAASASGGNTWSSPQPIGVPAARQALMPAIAASATGMIGVLLYGIVETPDGAGYRPYLMVSDGNLRHSVARPLDGALSPLGERTPWYLGDYAGISMTATRVAATWTGIYGAAERIYARQLTLPYDP
jgi:hypothetical protein